MRPRDRWTNLERCARFESYEERLALAVQPLGDMFVDASEQLEHHYGEVTTLWSGVHQATGVNYVRSAYGLDGRGQTVAIIDSGIAYDHVALGAGIGTGYRVVGGWDFAENDADPYDDGPAGFHGTHVAGIVGSADATYVGVAPGVDLVALRVFNDQGAGYFSWVESALEWVHQNRNAFANPITTVNLSLGTKWNSNLVPNWSTLEDEFAQLKADGIFVSVSAGNSFTEYRTPGLSYPAASPSVVPAASLDSNGSLSSFSQRSARVLAAPGRSITSTVPDHVFGADGMANDFGTVSGTSMASPYVAGASVLIRQAMELVGYQNISQDTIYNHLRSTAGAVYDAATSAYYHRIDVGAALNALVPADDYGSSAATAHALGTISGQTQVTGFINGLGDHDFFTFVAGKSGRVLVTAEGTGGGAFQVQSADRLAVSEDGSLALDVMAGQSYTFSVSAAVGIASYNVNLALEPAWLDLGSVEFTRLDNLPAQAGESWYQLNSARDGILTLEAFFNRAAGNLSLQLYDSNHELLATSGSVAHSERLDVTASAGQRFYLKITGSHDRVDLRLTNLVSVRGHQLHVVGTTGDDTLSWDAANLHLEVNGVSYDTRAFGRITAVTVHGGAGEDQFAFFGTNRNDRATLRVGSAQITGPGYSVRAEDVERVRVDARGGRNVLTLYDSPGDDALVVKRGRVTLSGPGFAHEGWGFERTYAFATGGGYDVARLFDSAGDDRFVARTTAASLTGPGYVTYVQQFERVSAYATRGGQDRAWLYDSAGHDTFVADNTSASLSGVGFFNEALQFSRVYAYSTRGGTDTARFNDSPGNDTFVAGSSGASLSGPGFSVFAQRFARVYASSSAGGNDVARLYDSAGNDRLVVASFGASLRGSGFHNVAERFERTYAYSTLGGSDRARFSDAAAPITFMPGGFIASSIGLHVQSDAPLPGHVDYASAAPLPKYALFSALGRDSLWSRADRWCFDEEVLSGSSLELDATLVLANRRVLAAVELNEVDSYFERVGGRPGGNLA